MVDKNEDKIEDKTGDATDDTPALEVEIEAAIEAEAQEFEAEHGEDEADVKADDKKDDDVPKGDGASADGDIDNGALTKDDEVLDEEDDNADGDDKADDDQTDAITDEHLERAVRAGLSMPIARQFVSASLLESLVSRLEKAQEAKADDGKGDDSDGEDPLAAIPDLDPKDYDENIVQGFKAMKGIIQTQNEMIKGLREKGPSADEWFDDQRKGLDKPVAEAVKSDPDKWKAIHGKFDVLAAGYAAAGQDVSRGDVFDEAVKITMSDIIAQAVIDKKTAALDKRKQQHINRASGHVDKVGNGDDVLAEVAAEVDQKFYNKPT